MFRYQGAIIREFFGKDCFVGPTSISGSIRPHFRHKSSWSFLSHFFLTFTVFPMAWMVWCPYEIYGIAPVTFLLKFAFCQSFDQRMASVDFCFWYSEKDFIPKPSQILTLSVWGISSTVEGRISIWTPVLQISRCLTWAFMWKGDRSL